MLNGELTTGLARTHAGHRHCRYTRTGVVGLGTVFLFASVVTKTVPPPYRARYLSSATGQAKQQLRPAPRGTTRQGTCEESYIGETERSLGTRFLEHKRPSSLSSEVSQHIHIESPGHTVSLDK
ncbi:hypothetical protein Bbelb_201280, partial [Branchiostoma belcheri]